MARRPLPLALAVGAFVLLALAAGELPEACEGDPAEADELGLLSVKARPHSREQAVKAGADQQDGAPRAEAERGGHRKPRKHHQVTKEEVDRLKRMSPEEIERMPDEEVEQYEDTDSWGWKDLGWNQLQSLMHRIEHLGETPTPAPTPAPTPVPTPAPFVPPSWCADLPPDIAAQTYSCTGLEPEHHHKHHGPHREEAPEP